MINPLPALCCLKATYYICFFFLLTCTNHSVRLDCLNRLFALSKLTNDMVCAWVICSNFGLQNREIMETIECAVLPSGNIFKMMILSPATPLTSILCIHYQRYYWLLPENVLLHPSVCLRLEKRDSFYQHFCPLLRCVALKQHIQNSKMGFHHDVFIFFS